MGDPQGATRSRLPEAFGAVYFRDEDWEVRLAQWMAEAEAGGFSAGNRHVIETAISDPEAGLRVVVNIGVHAILKLYPDGRYLNLYERPEIGGVQPTPSAERVAVDTALGLHGPDVYFGAVALGGVGVRYYGEYCLVLQLDAIDDDPQLFDRDSYDILIEPISGLPDRAAVIDRLKGSWRSDVHPMVVMKVLPELEHDFRLVTTGTVSEAVLKDQEFIEVHLRPDPAGVDPGGSRSFGPGEIEEIRESPDEVAVMARLREREAAELPMSAVEHEWLLRRECVSQVVGKRGTPTRVVTQHGRGYQWK